MDLLVPLIVAWALTTPPLEPGQASANEGRGVLLLTLLPHTRLGPLGMWFLWGMMLMWPECCCLGDMFAIKLCEFLTNLDPKNQRQLDVS